jgi:hypothetical protein
LVEPIMFVGVGFLIAGLISIGLIPLVHARAVRLTKQRLEEQHNLAGKRPIGHREEPGPK